MSTKMVASILGLVLACACSAASLRLLPPAPAGSPVQLNVTNNFGSPLEIYAVGGGTYYRMGTVLPGLTGHFVVREAMLSAGPIEFLAKSADGRSVIRSDRLLLAPGNAVDFNVESQATLSSATVRP